MFNLHYRLERRPIGFLLSIIGVASIGGAVEDHTVVTIHQTVEDAPDMAFNAARDRRPQYLHPGRLLRCHSQMIRTLRD